MLGLGRNVSSVLKHINVTSCRGVLFRGSKAERKLDTLRSLCLTSQRCGKLQSPREQQQQQQQQKTKKEEEDEEEEEEDIGKAIKFSTSKASHRTWNVERSLGSKHKPPLWRVLSISLFCVGFLVWCVFRQESEVDKRMEKTLSDHLSALDEDENDENSKPGS